MGFLSYDKLNAPLPLLFRYFLKVATLQFIIVFSTFILLLTLASVVFYLNQAKVFKIPITLEYIFSTVGISFEFIFPLIVAFSFYLTARFFSKRKLYLVLPSLGIPLRTFIPLIVTVAVINSILTLVYFEVIYPKSTYINYIAYLRSKNKIPQAGIIKNFWYKNGENQFIYFQIISLHDKKALNGKVLTLNREFNLFWIDNIPRATILLKEKKLIINSQNVTRYGFDNIMKLRNYSLTIPYQEKLFKVKMPKFFSLTELIQLLNYAKNWGLNTSIFLWELEKRILITIFVFLVSIYSFLTFFEKLSRAQKLENISEILKVFGYIYSFYLFIIFYQILVNKLSLNPLYGIAILVPYLGLLIKKWKSI